MPGLRVVEQVELPREARQQQLLRRGGIRLAGLLYGCEKFSDGGQAFLKRRAEERFGVVRPEKDLRGASNDRTERDHGETPEADMQASVRVDTGYGHDEHGRDAAEQAEVRGARGLGDEDEEGGQRSQHGDAEPGMVQKGNVGGEAHHCADGRAQDAPGRLGHGGAGIRLAGDEDRDDDE